MLAVCEYPTKKDCGIVASNLCQRFPETFGDFILVGSVEAATFSLMKQLKSRVENVQRSKPSKNPKKRLLDNAENSKATSSYGCPNWMPLAPPIGHTLESQEDCRVKLREYFTQAGPEGNEAWVDKAMEETYFMQRQDINSNMPLESIQDKWPFLFVPKYYLKHFEKLTSSNPRDNLTESLKEKKELLFKFYKKETTGEQRSILHLILLVVSDLKEPTDSLFLFFEVRSINGWTDI